MTNVRDSTKIFLVGVGRSGTSLLQAMLDSHNDIEFLPETGFLRRYIASREMPNSRLMDELRNDKRVARVAGSESALEKFDWTSRLPALHFYEELFSSSDQTWVGDKDPRSIELISVLAHIWPTSRIVHILRDPRDVVASKKKASWSRGRSLFSYLVAGMAQIRLAQLAVESLPAVRVHTLRYEDLIAEPQRELERICDWLSIEFDSGMLRFNEAATRLVSKEELQWKDATLRRLDSNNTEKWRDQLSDFEINAVEQGCQNAMEWGEYRPSESPISFVDRIRLAFLLVACRLAATLYALRQQFRNRRLKSKLC